MVKANATQGTTAVGKSTKKTIPKAINHALRSWVYQRRHYNADKADEHERPERHHHWTLGREANECEPNEAQERKGRAYEEDNLARGPLARRPRVVFLPSLQRGVVRLDEAKDFFSVHRHAPRPERARCYTDPRIVVLQGRNGAPHIGSGCHSMAASRAG